MFDMGFIKDLRYILRQLPPFERRQSMLFSATLSFDVMELAYVFMNDAREGVGHARAGDGGDASSTWSTTCGLPEKMHAARRALLRARGRCARARVHEHAALAPSASSATLVANGFAAAAITGDVDQRRRLRILQEFKDGHAADPGRAPTSRRAGSTSRASRTSSTTTCRSTPRTTSTASVAPRAPGASGKAISLACEDYVAGPRGDRALHRLQAPARLPDDGMLAEHVAHPPRRHDRPERHERGGHGRHGRHDQRESRPHHERRTGGTQHDAKPAHGAHAHQEPRIGAGAARRTRGTRRSRAADGARRSTSRAPRTAALSAPAADGAKRKRRRRRRKPGGAGHRHHEQRHARSACAHGWRSSRPRLFSTGGAAVKACSLGAGRSRRSARRSPSSRSWPRSRRPARAGRRPCSRRRVAGGDDDPFVTSTKLTTAANAIFLQSTAPLYVLRARAARAARAGAPHRRRLPGRVRRRAVHDLLRRRAGGGDGAESGARKRPRGRRAASPGRSRSSASAGPRARGRRWGRRGSRERHRDADRPADGAPGRGCHDDGLGDHRLPRRVSDHAGVRVHVDRHARSAGVRGIAADAGRAGAQSRVGVARPRRAGRRGDARGRRDDPRDDRREDARRLAALPRRDPASARNAK